MAGNLFLLSIPLRLLILAATKHGLLPPSTTFLADYQYDFAHLLLLCYSDAQSSAWVWKSFARISWLHSKSRSNRRIAHLWWQLWVHTCKRLVKFWPLLLCALGKLVPFLICNKRLLYSTFQACLGWINWAVVVAHFAPFQRVLVGSHFDGHFAFQHSSCNFRPLRH